MLVYSSPPQLSPVLILSIPWTYDQAELTLAGWLNTKMVRMRLEPTVTHPSTNRARCIEQFTLIESNMRRRATTMYMFWVCIYASEFVEPCNSTPHQLIIYERCCMLTAAPGQSYVHSAGWLTHVRIFMTQTHTERGGKRAGHRFHRSVWLHGIGTFCQANTTLT